MDTLILIRKVQRSFGDENNIFIKTDDIIDWINDAQLQIVRETDCLIEEEIVAANLFPWTLPEDFLKISRITYGSRPLVKTEVESLDAENIELTSASIPTMYYFLKNQLRLFPPPSVTDTTNVTINFAKLPVQLTGAGNSLTVPASYHEDVVRFCLARAHERNENYRGMEIAMAEFDNRISSRIDESEVQDEGYPVIRDDAFWSYQ